LAGERANGRPRCRQPQQHSRRQAQAGVPSSVRPDPARASLASLVRRLDLARASAAPRPAVPAAPTSVRERGGGVARPRHLDRCGVQAYAMSRRKRQPAVTAAPGAHCSRHRYAWIPLRRWGRKQCRLRRGICSLHASSCSHVLDVAIGHRAQCWRLHFHGTCSGCV
jgi:hypothetical protein